MNSKFKNIENIKLLIPDYVMGRLSNDELLQVENAVKNSDELKKIVEEFNILNSFVSSVREEEIPAAYWSSLLPRIHDKIEERESSKFSLNKLVNYWKVLVPVAAVLLIALIYFSFFRNTDEVQVTDKNKNEKRDTNTVIEKHENKIVKSEVKDSSEKTIEKNVHERKIKVRSSEEPSIPVAKEEQLNKQPIEKEAVIPDEETAEVNIDEESVFTGSSAGMDEETETEIGNLNEKEQEKLVQELMKSNL